MPQIPTFEQQHSAFVGDIGAHADPRAFAQPGEAAAEGGRAVTAEGNAWLDIYSKAQQQTRAADATAGAMTKMQDAAFRWSKTPDNMAAMAGFQTDAAKIKTDALAGINDPEVKAYVNSRLDEHSIALAHDTRQQAWALESSAARGSLDSRVAQYAQSAAVLTQPEARAQVRDQALADIDSTVAAGWLRPEEGALKKITFTSEVQRLGAERAINGLLASRNPDDATRLGQAIADPQNFPGMLPEVREHLLGRTEGLAYRLSIQQASHIAHADAIAERDLRRGQAKNEGLILSQIYEHKPVNMTQVEALHAGGQLSTPGLEAIHNANDRELQGRDDPLTAADLWSRVGKHDDVHDDALSAFNAHNLSRNTMIEIIKANSTQGDKADNAQVKEDFSRLKTYAGGHAVENGFFKDPGEQARHQALWGDAQKEFWQRVGQGEDSTAIVDDMRDRYLKVDMGAGALPNPRLGQVKTLADVNQVGGATFKAHEAGTMDDATYEDEKRLLNQYLQIYTLQEQQNAAAAAAAAAAKNGGGGATVRPGLVPTPGGQ